MVYICLIHWKLSYHPGTEHIISPWHCTTNEVLVLEPSCTPCSDFIMVQRKEVQQKIEKMIGMLMESRPNPVPSPMVFRTLVKYILFCASASPAPVTSNLGARVAENVEKARTAENIALWSFWTPEQNSLMCADNLPHVVFISSFSTGKTKCLQHRAFEIARKEKVLFVFCTGVKKKTFLQLTIENTVNKDESLKKKLVLRRSIKSIMLQTWLNHWETL